MHKTVCTQIFCHSNCLSPEPKRCDCLLNDDYKMYISKFFVVPSNELSYNGCSPISRHSGWSIRYGQNLRPGLHHINHSGNQSMNHKSRLTQRILLYVKCLGCLRCFLRSTSTLSAVGPRSAILFYTK